MSGFKSVMSFRGHTLSANTIFFAVQFKAVHTNWRGNNVSYAGLDGAGLYLWKNVPNDSRFLEKNASPCLGWTC